MLGWGWTFPWTAVQIHRGAIGWVRPLGDGFISISGVGELPGLNRNGHFHKKGEHESPYRPDPEGDHQFQEVGDIVINLAKGIRDKSGDDKPGSFLYPHPHDNEKTTQVKGAQALPCGRDEKAVTFIAMAAQIQGTRGP
jgi:hypothetical protein